MAAANNGESAYILFPAHSFGRLVFHYYEDGLEQLRSQEYADIKDIHFNPIVGLVIDFPVYRITIEGRNILEITNALNDKIVQHLYEKHLPMAEVPEDEPYIKKIKFEYRG